MVFPDPSKYNLVIDPHLPEEDLKQVQRWERWPKEAVVLAFLCAVLVMLPLGSVFMGDERLLEIIAWGMIALFVMAWFIVMDHRVFRPLVVTRRLIRQRRVLVLQDGPVWQTFQREHRRIGENVPKEDRPNLYHKLYLAIRDAACVEQSMQLAEECEDEFDVAVRAGDLVQRDAVLQKIVREIDLYDPSV